MSKNRTPLPDAWDDDWEAQADRLAKSSPTNNEPEQQQPPPPPLSKAERRAKHLEEQRRLWESAESPSQPAYLPMTTPIPFATPFKPPMKLLSRRPTAADDDYDDEDANTNPQKAETFEERKERQRKELEEKQRRYQEQRAKIFGDSNPSSGQSSPGTVTPPQAGTGNEGRGGHRGRGGRGRGNGRGRGDYNNNNNNGGNGRSSNNNRQQQQQQQQTSESQPSSSRELFDAEYTPKPNRRGGPASSQQSSRSHTPREEDQITRQPRGPDGSGRGGFGFAKRGAPNG
ncbi:hypothetical protein QBC41DRAFT_236522 [Cercophora samala]|uniref:SUZ domain-containing protein n=1 Tax=Cercophora samala TaxID=330535 RepID=A0AA39YXP4_9PEZI|nr:hypothetical protein QBC41DRAFT_236522 [Cercophora samala]